MRSVHWVWLPILALVIMGFTLSVRRMNSGGGSSPIIPGDTAEVKQLMHGLVIPASTTLFNAVGTVVDETGVHENRPETDEEWDQIEGAAAMLVEAGSLLTTPNRMKDEGDWIGMAQGLVTAAGESLKAAQARDADALFESGEGLVTACDNCHNEYQLETAN